MTRLIASDIAYIADTLADYEDGLRGQTGRTLKGLACHAVGVEEKGINEIFARTRARIVPVSWGAGLITGFAAAVAAILNQIDLAAAVTDHHNVGGLVEAYDAPCDLVFLSDDDDFTVFNLNRKKSVHNAAATGKGFAAGLDLMAGGIEGHRALVIGCGPVGSSAAAELVRRGARVTIYDLDPGRRRHLVDELSVNALGNVAETDNFDDAIRRHAYIVDATPAAGFIAADMIGPDSFVAAPGMPLGLSAAAVQKAAGRLLHDPLPIGVATMAVEALAELPAAII